MDQVPAPIPGGRVRALWCFICGGQFICRLTAAAQQREHADTTEQGGGGLGHKDSVKLHFRETDEVLRRTKITRDRNNQILTCASCKYAANSLTINHLGIFIPILSPIFLAQSRSSHPAHHRSFPPFPSDSGLGIQVFPAILFWQRLTIEITTPTDSCFYFKSPEILLQN